jgi:deoxyribodipyrimidine photo-lyase
MTAARRTRSSFALEHAARRARAMKKPLLVLEPLRVGYPWASDRIHRFVIEGMADNRARFSEANVTYYPYVEPAPGAGKGLLAALAARACVVVGDSSPMFFLPKLIGAARQQLDVRLETVEGVGLLPLSLADHAYPTARAYRYHVQRHAEKSMADKPVEDPLSEGGLSGAVIPKGVEKKYPRASEALLNGGDLGELPIDHKVGKAAFRGGSKAAHETLARFIRHKLLRYGEDRSHPDRDAQSGLSPYLHFGHIGVHEILTEVVAYSRWTPEKLAAKPNGLKDGFWGMPAEAEAFLDELITWREVGQTTARFDPDYEKYSSLPAWAKTTLEEHASDPRPEKYDRARMEAAKTGDEIWNAAQRELVREGRMQNYLRMLWGKKVLQWSATPEEAFETLVDLNNRYAVDGRDPSSYSGISWVFGRYDRPWAPVRPIFGSVRYMTSPQARKKLDMESYLLRFKP